MNVKEVVVNFAVSGISGVFVNELSTSRSRAWATAVVMFTMLLLAQWRGLRLLNLWAYARLMRAEVLAATVVGVSLSVFHVVTTRDGYTRANRGSAQARAQTVGRSLEICLISYHEHEAIESIQRIIGIAAAPDGVVRISLIERSLRVAADSDRIMIGKEIGSRREMVNRVIRTGSPEGELNYDSIDGETYSYVIPVFGAAYSPDPRDRIVGALLVTVAVPNVAPPIGTLLGPDLLLTLVLSPLAAWLVTASRIRGRPKSVKMLKVTQSRRPGKRSPAISTDNAHDRSTPAA